MINKKKSANTIKGVVQRVLKQILQENDVFINWKKITLPKAEGNRKYQKPKHITLQIVKAMKAYHHPIANGVFQFLLTGRRINEILYLKHENVNYINNTFTLPAEITKTKKEFTFNLTPPLINAIKKQKTSKGRIFKLENRQMLEHFKTAMASIGVYDMVIHDIRSMVAQTALDGGVNIYDVSKMLAHEKVATTEQAYVQGGKTQASRAIDTVNSLLRINDPIDIIDVEIIETKFNVIKNLYPQVDDKVIKYVIDILDKNVIP